MSSDPNLPALIDDDTLRSYLADALPAGELARVEKALRDSADLRARLEEVRQNRGDPNLHTLGAIWRRGRLTCPTRQQLGSYLLQALDEGHQEYIEFHLQTIGCAFCLANLADLRVLQQEAGPKTQERRRRIFTSSAGYLASRRDGKS